MNNDHFSDYYEDLQISPNADSETIERVFRLLAKRYHPDNKDTGNAAVEEGEIIISSDRLLPDPDSLVHQPKVTPKTNSFNNRSRRLIPVLS